MALLALAALAVAAIAQDTVVFQANALRWDERCCVESLQGLVNRDGPRLYLDYGNSYDGQWLGIYEDRYGLETERIVGLRELLDRFGDAADGLIVYDPDVDGSRYVAITLAGIENLLPVSTAMLEGTSPSLRADGLWAGCDFAAMDKRELDYWQRAASPVLDLKPGTGLALREGNPEAGQDWSFISFGPVSVDLAKYPFLEVDIADVSGENAGWSIKLTWDRDGSGWIGGGQDDLCLPVTLEAGTQRWNIAGMAGISGDHTFDKIQLHVMGAEGEITWRRVRFVSADGDSPSPVALKPLTESGFTLKRDLRGQFRDSLEAYDWALREVMPRCNRLYAHAVNGHVEGIRAGCGPFPGFDWPVMQKGFVFNLGCVPDVRSSYGDSRVGGSPEQAEMYKRILAALERPAQITGYGEPEGDWCTLLSQNGHYSFHFGPNWSFHRNMPAKRPEFRQQVQFTPENVKLERDKYYVCFMTSEGDTMKGPIPFFYGSWFEDARGGTPMNWGINPLMATQFPAMLEYFYDTATPNDYFFVGCSGAGYVYPDNMPNLEQFAQHTADACRLADTPCIDLWGARKAEVVAKYAEITDGLGLTINASPARVSILPDGSPVAYHELAYWQSQATGGDNWYRAFEDDERRAKAVDWLIDQIQNIARRHYPPFVILVYADLHNYAHHTGLASEVAAKLDPERFKPARLDEALSAMRVWTTDRVLLGSESINDRPSWAVLQGTPTSIPLTVTNTSRKTAQATVEVAVGPERAQGKATIKPGEAVTLADLTLSPIQPEDTEASLVVTVDARTETVPVDCVLVPTEQPRERVSLAAVWGAVGMRHHAGQTVDAADAMWGQAWQSPEPGADSGHVLFGPYAELPEGKYVIAFRMKATDPAAVRQMDADTIIATLDVFAGGYEGTRETPAKASIRAGEIARTDDWQWFTMEADWPGGKSLIETRVWWESRAQLLLDRVVAFRVD